MPLLPIISPSNPRIKQLRALSRRKERDATGLCVAEGIFHVGEALAAAAANRAAVEALFYAPDRLISDFGRGLVRQASATGIPTFETAADVLATVAEKDNPQGILAVVRPRRYALADLTSAAQPWLAAVVAPQDPGNVGAILRTLDAVGASGLLLLDGGVDAYHPGAVRASMGTVFRLPVVATDFAAFIAWARAGGYRVYGTSARGQTAYRATEYTMPLVLLLGSEREGLSVEQAAQCDALIRLPMHGRASSLNLAVAAGVMLYAIHDDLAARGLLPLPPL
ncbi:TrmH family RNA methyltransferase [Promineifilum sp.]|uniref:TrmH family RNA methyltransferase n=1 Tax=Promineifilum sp. TaxID=2664178 RepID=UPI0035B3162B